MRVVLDRQLDLVYSLEMIKKMNQNDISLVLYFYDRVKETKKKY